MPCRLHCGILVFKRMMRFDILTIFPHSLDSYLAVGMLARAIKSTKIDVRVHDLREFTNDPHRSVDDKPYGGGPGMVMKIGPIHKALKAIVPRRSRNTKVILCSAGGALFTQEKARHYSAECSRLVLICGRYEGIDARVRDLVDEEISIGKYVLTGGELAAAVVVDAVSRLLPGVLGTDASSEDESYSDGETVEYPQYTRPEKYRGKSVPAVLLSGDHKKIAAWRKAQRKRLSPN